MPPGNPSEADYSIAEPGQTVRFVSFEGELPKLMGIVASAFPPVHEGDRGDDGRGAFGVSVRIGDRIPFASQSLRA